MKVEIQIEPECKEPRAVIYTEEVTEEVSEAVKKLSMNVPVLLIGVPEENFSVMGRSNENVQIIEPGKIFHIYAANQKVFAVTGTGEYRLKMRLYELEEQLKDSMFVRISNSELINLRQTDQFDLSISGTICVKLKNKEKVYVSRRYVKKIKDILGM